MYFEPCYCNGATYTYRLAQGAMPMSLLLEKLSSYNIFNNLFPGILFVAISEKYTSYNFKQDDIVIGIFLYYFIGLVISRIGSLVIEPSLKKIKFLQFSDYKSFAEATRKDSKIELLSEVNNMYRSICSVLLISIAFVVIEKIENEWPELVPDLGSWLLCLLLLLFLFSYRKQTSYIKKRISSVNNEE